MYFLHCSYLSDLNTLECIKLPQIPRITPNLKYLPFTDYHEKMYTARCKIWHFEWMSNWNLITYYPTCDVPALAVVPALAGVPAVAGVPATACPYCWWSPCSRLYLFLLQSWDWGHSCWYRRLLLLLARCCSCLYPCSCWGIAIKGIWAATGSFFCSWPTTISAKESAPSMVSGVNGVVSVIFFAGVFAFPVFLDVAGSLSADGKIVLAGFLSIASLPPAGVCPTPLVRCYPPCCGSSDVLAVCCKS